MTRKPDPARRVLVIGAALSLLWLAGLALLRWVAPVGDAGWIAWVGALLPLALIWMAVGLAHAIARLRAEADVLRAELAQMRAVPRGALQTAPENAPETAPSRPAPPAPRSENAPRRAPASSATPRPPKQTEQPSLDLETPEPVRLEPAMLIAALNFPDGPEDHNALNALRGAMRDPDTARLLRSAQDMVVLLAENGLYMDELDMPDWPAQSWLRRHDHAATTQASTNTAPTTPAFEAAAEQVRTRMRDDVVFRDAAHHFLRLFDLQIQRHAPHFEAQDYVALSAVRSGRAFALIALAAGLVSPKP